MRAIPGYEGYAIDGAGRVFSLRRERPREMTPYPMCVDRRPYVKLVAHTRGGRKIFRSVGVGELQLLAQGKARPDGCMVEYLDGDSKNNSPGNLAWASRYKGRPGKRPYQRATGHKLNVAQVKMIRSLHAGGASVKNLAARFRCTQLTIYRVLRRESWKNA